MPTMLVDHMEGCTPFAPCVSCKAAAFLRSKLSESDLQQLADILYSQRSKYDRPIDQLDLSPRTVQGLTYQNLRTVGDLLKKSEAELLRTPNFGRKSLNEVKTVLASEGLALGQLANDS